MAFGQCTSGINFLLATLQDENILTDNFHVKTFKGDIFPNYAINTTIYTSTKAEQFVLSKNYLTIKLHDITLISSVY